MTRSTKAYLEEWRRVDDGQKSHPGKDNLQTSPSATESAKPLKFGQMTSLSSRRSLGTPRHHQSLRGKQLENPTGQLGSSREPNIGSTIASSKTRVQLYSPTAARPVSDRLKLPYSDEEIFKLREKTSRSYEMVLLRG